MSTVQSEVVSLAPTPQTIANLSDELTGKQKLFIYFYLEHRNATKAARLAGYAGDDVTLAAVGSENLRKPLIRSAIEDYWAARVLSTGGVLAELSDIASSPWREHVEVKYGDNGEVISAQLKLTDKIKALELTGKAQGMFVDRSESVNININVDAKDIADSLASALMTIDVMPEP